MNANRIKATTAAALVMMLAGCGEKRGLRASDYPYPNTTAYAALAPQSVNPPPPVGALPDFAAPGAAYPDAGLPQGAPLPDPSAWPGDDQPEAVAQGIEPLVRGPVHEAFAKPTTSGADVALVVPRQPPPDVPEVPPEDRPRGDNVIWIPGYWGWDAERADFIWLSGLWRDLPPGMRWTPGYWMPVENGFRWVPGTWLSAAVAEIQYLPPPPEAVEEEPSGPAPSEDAIWSPGCWVYVTVSKRYAWRHGSWLRCRADWTWVPAHYVWTPRGCIFVEGYWDHSLDRRGLLFAPVCFAQPIYRRPGFVYSPTIVINVNVLVVNLFVRPGDSHYCFGDYYDAGYRGRGILPLVDFHGRRAGFDPIFAHEKWLHRQDDPRWDEHQRGRYQDLRDGKGARPPRTFAAQQDQLRREAKGADLAAIARPVRDLTAGKAAARRVDKICAADRQKFLKQSGALLQAPALRARQEINPFWTKTDAGNTPAPGLKSPPALQIPRDARNAPAPANGGGPRAAPQGLPSRPTGPVVPREPVEPKAVKRPAPAPAPAKAPVKMIVKSVEKPDPAGTPGPLAVPIRGTPAAPSVSVGAPVARPTINPVPRVAAPPVEPARPQPVDVRRPTTIQPPRPMPVEVPRATPVEAPRPVRVEQPRPAPAEAPRPVRVEQPRPVIVEHPRLAPAENPRPAPVGNPRLVTVEAPRPTFTPPPPAPVQSVRPAPAPVERPRPAASMVERPAASMVERPAASAPPSRGGGDAGTGTSSDTKDKTAASPRGR